MKREPVLLVPGSLCTAALVLYFRTERSFEKAFAVAISTSLLRLNLPAAIPAGPTPMSNVSGVSKVPSPLPWSSPTLSPVFGLTSLYLSIPRAL